MTPEDEIPSNAQTDTASAAELETLQRITEETTVAHYQLARAEIELANYYVEFAPLTKNDVRALRTALVDARNEQDIQGFLTKNPLFLAQYFFGSHGRWLLPKPKLGKDLIPDFLLADQSSAGIDWRAIELETPFKRMFTLKGQPSATLTQAIQQVINWRDWLTNNIAYAQKPVAEYGLGLVGIDGNLPATILIGRRADYPDVFNAFRRQTEQNHRVSIHSYDALVDEAEFRASQ